MTLVIGVDAGGTSTTAAVWRAGTRTGTAVGGAGAVRPGRVMVAASRIAEAVRLALTEARILRGDVLVVGAAGAGRQPEREELHAALRGLDLAERLVITTDVDLALSAAFGGDPGIILIAGTGSIAVRRDADGSRHRAGGLGWQAGDEGSGYWVGRKALRAAFRARDGRGEATSLDTMIPRALRLPDHSALVGWSVTAAPAEVASLARVVGEAAANGDRQAEAILEAAADELTALVRAVAPGDRAGGAVPVPVALSGGLVGTDKPLNERVRRRLASIPGLTERVGSFEPVEGALHLA